jgi:hypothetical protein
MTGKSRLWWLAGRRRDERDDRWGARVGLSALVSVAVFVTPVLIAIGTATEVAHLVSLPRSQIGVVAWWVLLIAVPGVV